MEVGFSIIKHPFWGIPIYVYIDLTCIDDPIPVGFWSRMTIPFMDMDSFG